MIFCAGSSASELQLRFGRRKKRGALFVKVKIRATNFARDMR
jgi:hypothetical protein